ncbi:MAG: TRAP transporter small permease subunit [Betaproteobacteria bacterium]|nr:TRAP transporter small permease subunit [Betaproteobacteria bacterium]
MGRLQRGGLPQPHPGLSESPWPTCIIASIRSPIASARAQELEWHLLVPLVLAGMSYTLRHGEHVRSDILYHRLSERARARIDLASSVLLVLIALAIAWLSLLYVQQAFVIGEKSPDPGGLGYRWALKAMMPVGFVLLAVQATSCAIAAVQQLRAARA